MTLGGITINRPLYWTKRLSLESLRAPTLAFAVFAPVAIETWYSPILIAHWVALAIGTVGSRHSIKNKVIFTGLIALMGSYFAAILGAKLYNAQAVDQTVLMALFAAPMLVLYLNKNTIKVLPWLVPMALALAGSIFVSGLVDHIGIQASGFAHNPNPAAGVLVAASVYTLTTRKHWLALPMIAAVALTGSRAAEIVMVIMLGMLWMRGYRPWSLLLAVVAATVGVFYTLALDPNSITPTFDLAYRLQTPGFAPSIMPFGVVFTPGLHNVPARIAYELGIVSAAVWIGVSIWALYKLNGSNKVVQLMFIAILGLSVVDYYVWLGPMLGWWWLMVGIASEKGPKNETV